MNMAPTRTLQGRWKPTANLLRMMGAVHVVCMKAGKATLVLVCKVPCRGGCGLMTPSPTGALSKRAVRFDAAAQFTRASQHKSHTLLYEPIGHWDPDCKMPFNAKPDRTSGTWSHGPPNQLQGNGCTALRY